MNKLLEKITPTDIIAFVLIVGCLILKGFEFNGTVSNILLAITAVYFGKTQIADPVIKRIPKTIGKESVEQTIRRIAKMNGVDEELAVRVAKCESSLNPRAININDPGSKDRGVFQWNDYWHKEITDEMAFDVEIATNLFCQAVKNGNLKWWNASKHCWNK